MSYWCSLVTSLSKAPSSETIWTVLAIMASALIAVGAAFLSAWLTMKNARKLQDRERRRDEKSVAALVSADLYGKLSMLARISQCAVERRCFSVGANPTRQLSLQPVAVGAVHRGNDMD